MALTPGTPGSTRIGLGTAGTMLGSTGMSTFGSPRAGLKKELDSLFNKVQEHEDAIVRLDATIEKNAAIADDSLKAVQASLKASLASLRDEMNRKLQAITIEIAAIQKQLNVARGESNILAQQQRDTSKRVDLLTATVAEISAEIVGDETHPNANGGIY